MFQKSPPPLKSVSLQVLVYVRKLSSNSVGGYNRAGHPHLSLTSVVALSKHSQVLNPKSKSQVPKLRYVSIQLSICPWAHPFLQVKSVKKDLSKNEKSLDEKGTSPKSEVSE